MLFDGMEYACTRKVRITRKSTTAAAMDLIHSSVSFFFGSPGASFAGAGLARAAARVAGLGTGLGAYGERPGRGSGGPRESNLRAARVHGVAAPLGTRSPCESLL